MVIKQVDFLFKKGGALYDLVPYKCIGGSYYLKEDLVDYLLSQDYTHKKCC